MPLTSWFRKTFPDFTADAGACLEALAHVTDRCISSVEARHALTRRITTMQGLHTWAPKLAATSAEFTLRQILAEMRLQGDDPAGAGATKPSRQGKQPGARGGGGGSYRAFLHERSRGQRLTLASIRSLTLEYHGLDEASKAYYRDQGRLATLAWRKLSQQGVPAV